MTVASRVAMPRYRWVPEIADDSWAVEAIELMRSAGIVLDPHQEDVTRALLGRREDGKWAAFEVADCEPRQNGKGVIFEARLMAGLFITDERFLMHSAHRTDTSLDAMRRLLEDIEEAGLQTKIRRVRNTNGQEGIEMLDGRRLRFRTRNKGGGRGFSGDFVGADECFDYPEFAHSALLPTLSARPNPQAFYATSAVDQDVHENGLVFARLRGRGMAGGDPSLAYFEFSAPFEHPNEVPEESAADPEVWRQANPALGLRITEEYVANEQRSMDSRGFAVERLGVGDWPDPADDEARPISVQSWVDSVDEGSSIVGPVCFGFDVSPERRTSIAAAGRNADGRWHVEVIEKLPGTGWLPARLADLVAEHGASAVVADRLGPGASTLAKLAEMDVQVELVDGSEHARACAALVDAVAEDNLRHLGSVDLLNAVRSARVRQMGDRWLWSRRNSSVDISPLVAATLALWAAMGQPEDDGEVRIW